MRPDEIKFLEGETLKALVAFSKYLATNATAIGSDNFEDVAKTWTESDVERWSK